MPLNKYLPYPIPPVLTRLRGKAPQQYGRQAHLHLWSGDQCHHAQSGQYKSRYLRHRGRFNPKRTETMFHDFVFAFKTVA